MKASTRPDDLPSAGDVLITTELGIHFLSVMPHPHRLSFTNLAKATEIANRWAKANHARVWRRIDGELRPHDTKTSTA
jgi:hypothetical protein